MTVLLIALAVVAIVGFAAAGTMALTSTKLRDGLLWGTLAIVLVVLGGVWVYHIPNANEDTKLIPPAVVYNHTVCQAERSDTPEGVEIIAYPAGHVITHRGVKVPCPKPDPLKCTKLGYATLLQPGLEPQTILKCLKSS